ncbi:MAG: hypothetical protein NVS2B11_13300 [Acetobacteraceae bacterium]
MDTPLGLSASPNWRPEDHAEPSVFRPEHLLREARRQLGRPEQDVPAVCVLDPDGDLVRHLRGSGAARPSQGWACYHTDLVEFDRRRQREGVGSSLRV